MALAGRRYVRHGARRGARVAARPRQPGRRGGKAQREEEEVESSWGAVAASMGRGEDEAEVGRRCDRFDKPGAKRG